MLAEDVKENPGTLVLAASWLILFALLEVVEFRHRGVTLPDLFALRLKIPPGSGPWFEPIPISTVTSHRFGDLTWAEVRRGESWRLLTAAFVHFGLVHVAQNVLGLIIIGRLIEPWYRTGPFLAICLVIGAFGNLLGAVTRLLVASSRPWLDASALGRRFPRVLDYFLHGGPGAASVVHSGGGSTVLLGLFALAAVVGWRSKTRDGSTLQRRLVLLLALTFILGLAMPHLVDNYGHLGGAIVGAIIGLFDRPLVRLADIRWFRRVCWGLVAAASAATVGLMIHDDRRESALLGRFDAIVPQLRRDEATLHNLERLFVTFGREVIHADRSDQPIPENDASAMLDLLHHGPTMSWSTKPTAEERRKERQELREALDQLDRQPLGAWGEPTQAELGALRALGRAALDNPPRFDQVYAFVVDWESAIKVIRREFEGLKADLIGLEREIRQVR